MDQELVATASRGIEVLRQATTEFNLLGRLQDAIQLVGLGRGLTPSGDDLLGGFLYTLHALDSPCWRSLDLDWEGVDRWLSQVRLLTNKISFTILADLARADAAAPLHEFLNAALTGKSLECLVRAAGRVSAIGQSSGWDMLAGVYCACSVVERVVEHDSELFASSSQATLKQASLRETSCDNGWTCQTEVANLRKLMEDGPIAINLGLQ